MNKLEAVYESEIYTIIIVALALISLFSPISDEVDLCIDGIFIIDLLISTTIFIM